MIKIQTYDDIDRTEWSGLVQRAATATWFQTPEAYQFYMCVPQEMTPFAWAVVEEGLLMGVVVGYITNTTNHIKQYFTHRAIIIGGPLLDENISDEALSALLTAVRTGLRRKAIYIETRNFHDYSCWRTVFASQGFSYQPHLNFHVDCIDQESMLSKISESRRRQIKKALSSGVEISEAQSEEEVKVYYNLLKDLYTHKVKTPLQSQEFFLFFYRKHFGKYLLVRYNGNIIGGIMCPILDNRTIYEWFVCGQDEQYKKQYPSVLATYAAMDYAVRNHILQFDFMGAGKPDEAYGVRDFKARFGGEQVEYGRFLCVCRPFLYQLGKWGVKLLKMR